MFLADSFLPFSLCSFSSTWLDVGEVCWKSHKHRPDVPVQQPDLLGIAILNFLVAVCKPADAKYTFSAGILLRGGIAYYASFLHRFDGQVTSSTGNHVQ